MAMSTSLDVVGQRADLTYVVHGKLRGRPYATIDLGLDGVFSALMIHCDRSFLTRAIDAFVKARAALDEAERAVTADTQVVAESF